MHLMPVSIMSFRLLANMFAHESGAAYVAIDGGRVEALLAAAIAGMGHAEARVRQAASAVFYNCSLHMEKGLTGEWCHPPPCVELCQSLHCFSFSPRRFRLCCRTQRPCGLSLLRCQTRC